LAVGHHLYIHRAAEWHEADRHPIPADEWLAVVAADPQLRRDPDKEYLVLWPGPCRYPGGTWFDWFEGRVYTKNPDRPTLAKMLELARRLGARVQGDHGEFYNRPEDMPAEEDLAAARARRPTVPPGLALLGCALAGLVALFVFGVGAVTVWRWLWR
jgi:hypothetical protein